MRDRRILAAILPAALCSLGVLWLTDLPLGVAGPPEEWTWNRIRLDENQLADLLFGCVIATVVAAGYVVFVALGSARLDRCSRSERVGWLSGLVLAGFVWLLAVQESPPSPHGMSKTPFVLYYPGPSGYFTHARYKMQGVDEFLSHYQARVAQGSGVNRVLHIGTHPPGLFLFHRGMISLCERFPGLTAWLLEVQPESVVLGLDTIAQNAQSTSTPLLPVDRAAIWLAALITQFFGVATIVPLYLLLRRGYSALSSWRTAAFWPFIPALAIFLPKSDALLPFLGTLFLATRMIGRDRRSMMLCFVSGGIFWLGMFLSLAVLPYALLAVFMTLWEVGLCAERREEDRNFRWECCGVASAVAGFVLPVIVIAVSFDLNLVSVWLQNYQNHADFYAQFPRTYWKWLLINPLELAFAAGFPLALTAIWSIVIVLRSRKVWRHRAVGPVIGCSLVWSLLWLSGKNSGEVARLWLVVQPWLLWLTAYRFNPVEKSEEAPKISAGSSTWILLLIVQVVVCLATVTRVSGFHFSD